MLSALAAICVRGGGCKVAKIRTGFCAEELLNATMKSVGLGYSDHEIPP